MSRATRNLIATVLFALAYSSGAAWFIYFFYCFGHFPSTADPRLGLVFPLDDHGFHVYVGIVQQAAFHLLGWCIAVGALGFTLFVGGKEGIPPPPGAPRWLSYVSGRATNDLAHPTKQQKVVLCCAIVFWLAIFWLVGPALARFAAAHGFA
jgi:hypothetical protein